MEKLVIITDSTVDLPKEVLAPLNVEVMPVLINFGEESYLDGVEIELKDVFNRIEKGDVFPTTAQITPNRFVECFEKHLKEGSKVLAILMSSGMSGTYNAACLAKQMLETEDVHIIDSQTITSGLGLLVMKAARLREENVPVEEIVKQLEDMKPLIKSSISFESLDNLVKGGRLPKAVGVIAGVLGIRLILEIKDGVMNVKDKVRGSKKASKKIIADLEAYGHRKDMPVILINLEADDVCDTIKEYLISNDIEYIETVIGCSVGIHSGNNASGILFVGEK